VEKGENPKSEARNPKQARNSNDQNPKPQPTEKRSAFVLDIRILDFEFVSIFGFRDSNLVSGKGPR
jgi:hypothetical protein